MWLCACLRSQQCGLQQRGSTVGGQLKLGCAQNTHKSTFCGFKWLNLDLKTGTDRVLGRHRHCCCAVTTSSQWFSDDTVSAPLWVSHMFSTELWGFPFFHTDVTAPRLEPISSSCYITHSSLGSTLHSSFLHKYNHVPPCSRHTQHVRVENVWLIWPQPSALNVMMHLSCFCSCTDDHLHFMYWMTHTVFLLFSFLFFLLPPLPSTPGSPSAWQHSQRDTSTTQEEHRPLSLFTGQP